MKHCVVLSSICGVLLLALPLALAQAPQPQVPQAAEDNIPLDKPMLALDTGGHTSAVYKLIVNPYDRQLISVGLDKTIRFWDLDSGEPLRVLHPPVGQGAHGYLFCAAISPDGKTLAAAGYRAQTPLYDHRIHLIALPEGRLIRSLKGHAYAIYDMAFSHDGKRLASASHDATVRIWDVDTGATLQTLKGHTEVVHGVAWSADDKSVVSGSMDKTARIWNVEKATATAVLREHTGQLMTVAWSPDGRTVATGCNDRSIRLYEPSGKFRYAWSKLPNEITSVQFSPDSQRLLYTYGSNTQPPVGTAILDMVKGKELARHTSHDNGVLCGTFSPDGKLAITGDSVSHIRVWNSANGALVRRLDGPGESMISVGWSPDTQAIAFGTRLIDNLIDVGAPVDRTFCFRALDFGPPPNKTFVRAHSQLGPLKMGLNVATTPVDMRKVYFMQNGSLLNTFTLPQPYDQVRCYTLFPGERAAIGTQDGAYLLDVKTGLVQQHLSDRGEELWGMAPSYDSRYLATAGNDQVVRIWHVDSRQLLLSLFVARDEWIAWTPQGYYAASLAGESLMGWHINKGAEALADFFPAAHFHKSLYRPDVIRHLLEMGDLTKAVEFADQERKEQSQVIMVSDVIPPTVSIASPGPSPVETAEETVTVRASATPTAGEPITAMRLVVDGRPWDVPRSISAPAAGETQQPVEQEWKLALPPGKYNIVAKAETAKSYALSRPVEVTRTTPDATPVPTKLYVLSIGGSAQAIPQALATASRGVFVEVVPSVLEGNKATPSAIAAELEKIQSQATPADTVLIYLSGQESLDAAGNYQLSASSGGATSATSAAELKQQLARIPGRVMFMLDTTRAEAQMQRQVAQGFCGSVGSEDHASKLDLAASDFLRELLTEEYGVVVLSASRRTTASKTATPSSSFVQAFKEAVGGQADENHDGVVYLQELAGYLNRRVRELSGGKQSPVIERPRGMRSFPIAKPEMPAPFDAK